MVAIPLSLIPTRTKLVTLDLDGTVVNRGGGVSDGTRQQVLRLQRKGISVCLATGRAWFGAKKIAKELEISSPSLFFSGALILNPATEEVFVEQHLDPFVVHQLLQEAAEQGIYTEIYTRDDYFVEEESSYGPLHAQYLNRLPQLQPFAEIVGVCPILKLGFIVQQGEEGRLKELFMKFPSLSSSVAFGAAHPDILFGNVTDGGATREAGFKLLTTLHNVHAQEVISFGDGESDLPFLRLAGLGVAVGNASLSVKEAADFVTASVEEDGVAQVLAYL